jgi:hypothetical protein
MRLRSSNSLSDDHAEEAAGEIACTVNSPAWETFMQPTKCPACHSDQLAHGPLVDHVGVRLTSGFWKSVAVHAAACLACGVVTPYLDDAALDKVREWTGDATKEKAFVDEV